MARSLWSGAISFGLVSVPVKLVTAVRDHSIRFNMLTPDGTCRLRQKLYCPDTGKEYDFGKAARGYEIAPNQYVLIEDEELARLRPEAGRDISIIAFVSLDEIDPLYFDRSYYLVPDEAGTKAYGLLVAAMKASGQVALARFVMRDREHLATLRPKENVLVLHTMYYNDEVISPDDLEGLAKKTTKAPAAELKLAEHLVAALAGAFDPTEYKDEFRDKVRKAIEAKAEGEEIVTARTDEPEAPRSYNLMEALKKSLAKAEKAEAPRTRRAAPRAAPRTRRKSA